MAKQETKHKVTTRVMKHSFSLKLTESEILERAKDMTKVMQQRDQLQSELKAIKDDFKSKIERKNADISLFSNQISTGMEWVTKECEVEMHPKQGVKKFYFEGVMVAEETMTKEDFQLTIDDGK